MASAEREPDQDEGSGTPGGDGYPLLFSGDARRSRPGILKRILAGLVRFFRETEPDPGLPPAPRRSTRSEPLEGPEARPFEAVVVDTTDSEPGPIPLHRATLQMLPGRLVPVKGNVVRQELRFLRPPDPGQVVTLGREARDPPEHVTIDHPSVQMRHASMRYLSGHWWIRSLSGDDPVRLNGRPLEPGDGPRHVKNGDRVRLGDLDFDFRVP